VGTLLTKNSLCHTLSTDQSLHDNWTIIGSDRLDVMDPAILSTPQYDPSSWYPASIPTTVLNVLEQQGIFPNILNGLTLQTIPNELFNVPWWYRTSFQVTTLSKNTELVIRGINYRADIWLNGKKIANADTIYGPFKQYQLDITSSLKRGENVLLFKIIPPQSDDFRIGFVDWNPNPPDHSMGIVRDVKLHFNEGIELQDLFVKTDLNSPENDQAKINLQVTVINHQSEPAAAEGGVTLFL
jgi:exo-1,4-beta-D-glucosaminidase